MTKFTGKFAVKVRGPRPLARENKYNASKVFLDGYRFDSKLEAGVYMILKKLVEAGDLADLRCQHTVYLSRSRDPIRPDFSAINTRTGKREFFEATGYRDRRKAKNEKKWKAYGPATLWVYEGRWDKIMPPRAIVPDEPNCLCVKCDPMANTGDEE